MKKIKLLSIFAILILCLAFNGCSSKDIEKQEQHKTTEEAPKKVKTADEKNVKADKAEDVEETKRIEDDPATAALKAHAKTIETLYSEEFNVVFDTVKFMLADFSEDGQPELLAVGVYDDSLSYMEIYAYQDGKVSKIFDGQCGAANGINMYPIRYEGVAYVMRESISSAMGFYQQLMHYNGTDWFTVESSFVEFDFYNNGEKKGCIVNDAPASDEVYEAMRKKVDEGYMQLEEFVFAEKL